MKKNVSDRYQPKNLKCWHGSFIKEKKFHLQSLLNKCTLPNIEQLLLEKIPTWIPPWLKGSNSSDRSSGLLSLPSSKVIDVYILQLFMRIKWVYFLKIQHQTEDMLTMLLMLWRQIVIKLFLIVLNFSLSIAIKCPYFMLAASTCCPDADPNFETACVHLNRKFHIIYLVSTTTGKKSGDLSPKVIYFPTFFLILLLSKFCSVTFVLETSLTSWFIDGQKSHHRSHSFLMCLFIRLFSSSRWEINFIFHSLRFLGTLEVASAENLGWQREQIGQHSRITRRIYA